MRLYLDSANIDEWQKCAQSGLVFGVTTNPLLARRAGLSYSNINWSERVVAPPRIWRLLIVKRYFSLLTKPVPFHNKNLITCLKTAEGETYYL